MGKSLIEEKGLKTLISEVHAEIKALYKNDDRPWVVGYSGGKDSTALVQLVFNALNELKVEEGTSAINKDVYIVTSDTLIENPLIIDYLNSNFDKINASASDLRITAHPCKAEYKDSFWTLLIGKGYPSPRQKFRWCTDRLKIRPIDNFIKDKIDAFGEVIVILGVRSEESISRKRVIDSHRIDNRLLKKHTTLNNAFTYTPIEDFQLDDIWGYLLNVPNPWGADNLDLFRLYSDSQDSGECPLQYDSNMPSCGNSRFGCWACTVVQEDKSLTGFIKNGHKELMPLLQFRNFIYEIRNQEHRRQNHRLDGSIYYLTLADGTKKQGLGPFTLETRKEILSKLLNAQSKAEEIAAKLKHDVQLNLITYDELQLIRKHWIESGDWNDSLPQIYETHTGRKFASQYDEREIFQIEDRHRLAAICESKHIDVDIIKQLIQIENRNAGLKRRSNIMKDIASLLTKDWIHEEIIDSLEELKEGIRHDH